MSTHVTMEPGADEGDLCHTHLLVGGVSVRDGVLQIVIIVTLQHQRITGQKLSTDSVARLRLIPRVDGAPGVRGFGRPAQA